MSPALAIRTEPLDELTLRRAQRGDERALARAGRAVSGAGPRADLAPARSRARHRVEDLVQETFVRMLRTLPSWDLAGAASLQTWILTIATRLTLNELRRPEMAAIVAEPPSTEAADAASERARLGAAIAAGVAALPDAQRTLLSEGPYRREVEMAALDAVRHWARQRYLQLLLERRR